MAMNEKRKWIIARPARLVLVSLAVVAVAPVVLVLLVSADAPPGLPEQAEMPPLVDEPTPTPRSRKDIATPPWDGVPDGYTIIEGDIIVPVGQLSVQGTWASNLWPGGDVPYEFDANVVAGNRTAMQNAMAEWEAVANVDFQHCAGNDCAGAGEGNYVHIQDSTENSSMVGMQEGSQVINIFNWGWRFIMAHELAHTLGLWHEQSRPNRDDYVIIETQCIQDGQAHNFAMNSTADQYPQDGQHTPAYDFDSVMHYGQSDFFTPTNAYCASIGRTITVRGPYAVPWQADIGQRNHLSDIDIMTMSFLYPEEDWMFVDHRNTGFKCGSFLHPWDTFAMGAATVPSGGTVIIQPGTYPSGGSYRRPMTLEAPLGGVLLDGSP